MKSMLGSSSGQMLLCSRNHRVAAVHNVTRRWSAAPLTHCTLTAAISSNVNWGCYRTYDTIKHNNTHSNVRCRSAAASSPSEGAEPADTGIKETLILGLLFAGWYGANIVFNIYNKQVLKAFPNPLTCTALQFVVGALVASFCWATGLIKRPHIDGSVVRSIFPLAAVHTLGNLLTNVSLGAVAVSFTHTIKAMEPLFSVLLSAIFLGDSPSPAVLLTLFPIVGGVALASMAEASFNWTGFLSAMGSNLTFQSRNVLSKKLMVKKGGLDNINLFSIITVISAVLLLPVAVVVEGWQFSPAAMAARGVAHPSQVMQQAVIAGLCFHTYQQVSYMILQRVSPVTHSIGNCVKRVIVIVASVIAFSHPVSQQNAIGTAVALAGVFAYSQAKRLGGKTKGA